jgi:hypothetical protein
MDNLYKNITPQFGDTPEKIDTKRQSLVGYLNSKGSAPTAKGFGIDLHKFNSTRPVEPTNVQMRGGVPYQKVQGGWKRVQQ